MQRLFKILGIVLACTAGFFIIEKIWSNRQWFSEIQATTEIVTLIITGAFTYAAGSFLLSFAWKHLLCCFGSSGAVITKCHIVYARTQIAKYIPGNVFHLAGRHVMANHAGADHGQLTGAAIYEVAGLLFASSVLALTGTLVYGINQTQASPISLSIILLSVLLLPLLLNKVILMLPRFRKFNFPERTMVEYYQILAPAYLLYILFFLLSGGILCIVTETVSDIETVNQAGFIVMTLSVSWIAGFITPGASGGIGVREALMVVLLTRQYGEPSSLLIAIVFRIVTLIGDFLFFLSSFVLPTSVSAQQRSNR